MAKTKMYRRVHLRARIRALLEERRFLSRIHLSRRQLREQRRMEAMLEDVSPDRFEELAG